MSSMTAIIIAQQAITRYVLPTILALGNLGNLISIVIFSQKQHRKNSGSIYLIAASFFSLVAANWAIVPTVYALDNTSLVNTSLALCRIRGYIIHVSSKCFHYTILLLCADRWALCNSHVSIRVLCRPQIAYRSISIITLFWIVVSIHLLIFESIENGRCGVYGTYGFIYSIYNLVFGGILPISLMILLSIMLMNSLRQVRSRVQPLHFNRRLHKRDVNLIVLVLAEVIVCILCIVSYPPFTIYLTVTNNTVMSKSPERIQIESFINFITLSLLFYLNYNTTFYVYVCASKAFRNEVKQLALKCIGKARDDGRILVNRPMIVNTVQLRRSFQMTTTF